ncbi:TetR/AcrR family transcriptional regulator [Streptomyces thinghirensis]|nr:TetR/AcrR family transcriptional regulator [Streptomyces thinghirensis]
MAVSRAEQRAATRHALLAEGRRRFANDGYHHVVLAQVAQAAGVTKGAACHHFDNKAGLFRAVVREVQQEGVSGSRPQSEDTRTCGSSSGPAAGPCWPGADPAVRQVPLVDAPTVLGWDEWAGHGRRVLRPAPRGGPDGARRSRDHR